MSSVAKPKHVSLLYSIQKRKSIRRPFVTQNLDIKKRQGYPRDVLRKHTSVSRSRCWSGGLKPRRTLALKPHTSNCLCAQPLNGAWLKWFIQSMAPATISYACINLSVDNINPYLCLSTIHWTYYQKCAIFQKSSIDPKATVILWRTQWYVPLTQPRPLRNSN